MTEVSGEQVEIEIKLDVPTDFVLPDLRGLPGVTDIGPPIEHELAATYFDTPDGRLARAGITLRRRTGGADAGWHLKHPKIDGARLEVHRPLGRSKRTPPRSLVNLARVHVRDSALLPVATLVTRRVVTPLLDDRRVLAEVADDQVRGELADGSNPVTWREVEVELVDGERSLLEAAGVRLGDAGAVESASSSKLARVLGAGELASERDDLDQSTAGAVVRQHLADQVSALVRWDPLARLDAPDAVHKMRVATRRLRSALATFRRVVDRAATDPVRAELKWLGQVLGGPRDEEVMHERLRDLLADQPKELVLGPVRRRIDLELGARHRVRHRAMVAELDGARYFRLLDALDALVAEPAFLEPAERPAADVLSRLVARARRRVLRLAEAADHTAGSDDDLALHEVRKAAKRARYAGEAVAPVFGEKATRFAESMEHLQEVLGEHQDSLVTQQLLRQLGVQAHLAGENGFTFGRLHGLEAGRADRAEGAYAEALAAVAGKAPRWLR